MKLTFAASRYIMTCRESHWQEFRDAGWVFNRLDRTYVTSDWRKAAVYVDYAQDDFLYFALEDKLIELQEAMSASYSMYAEADIAVPYITNHKGEVLDYLPYQKAGILYACEEGRDDTLIADSPGLGKTIQAIGIINHMDLKKALIVCPATLKLNWLKEMTKWLVDKTLTIGVAYGGEIPNTDIVIINYDILKRNRDVLWSQYWDILVCDEAQYLSNATSGRTEVVFGKYGFDYASKKWKRIPQRVTDPKTGRSQKLPCIRATHRVMLTGTPMMKKPVDMWPMIRDFDPDDLGANYDDFAMTYCDGVQGPFGLEANGGSNLGELNEKLRRKFMIRRLKKNVLADLPPKTREVVVFPAEGLKKLIKTERDKFTDALAMLDAANTGITYSKKLDLKEVDPALMLDTMTTILPQGFSAPEIADLDGGEIQPGFAAYSEARRDLALSKIPMAAEHIKRLVESDEKVIVFAIHKEVIAELHKHFPTAARIIGGMGAKKVEAEKLRFQGDNDNAIEPEEDCRVILCNLKAGGVGHTLTEATIVVFVEMWSVPGDMEQCEDRAHRYGLEHNVLVQYLVVDGTMDALTIQTLIDRIAMIEEAVDGTDPNDEMRKAA